MSLALNMLCQSPVSDGQSQADAIHETVRLCQLAEQSGYGRFWVAEHHNDVALACASPEILLTHLASITSRIRLGSGGVLLPHYSPYKVAEQFRMLGALFPDRIDLGIGRSGGTEGQATAALQSNLGKSAPFADAVELLRWLGDNGPLPATVVTPTGAQSPDVWVLGTSPASAKFAAQNGLPYAFGGFIDPRHTVNALTTYHRDFNHGTGRSPRVNLGWFVLAAETEGEADELMRTSERWFVETFLRGGNATFRRPEEINMSDFSMQEQAMIAFRRQNTLWGTADKVVEGLQKLQRDLRVDELTLVTITWSEEARRQSYESIARIADLNPS